MIKVDMVFTDPPYGIDVVSGNTVGGDKPFGNVGGNNIVKANKYMSIKGDDTIDGKPYTEIVDIARKYIKEIGGFEKFAEWGLY